WSRISDWQIKRKCAADVGRTPKLDFAAQQVRQLAADRKPQAGAAVFAAGACVCLLERLENDFLFFRRDTDAGVGHLEGDDALGLTENQMGRCPAYRRSGNLELDATAISKLECIREEILEHLLQPLGVGDEAAPERRIEIDVE